MCPNPTIVSRDLVALDKTTSLYFNRIQRFADIPKYNKYAVPCSYILYVYCTMTVHLSQDFSTQLKDFTHNTASYIILYIPWERKNILGC